MDKNSNFLSIDGHRLHLQTFNDNHPGTPIVLVHGLLMNNGFWSDDVVKLCGRFGPVILLSLPGHFPSTSPKPFEEVVDDAFLVKYLVAQYESVRGTEPAIWIGHSTGALAVMCVALARPELVTSLGILSTKPDGKEDGGIYGFFQWLHTRLGRLGNKIFGLIIKANSVSRRFHKFLLADSAKDPKKMFAYPNFDNYIDGYLTWQKNLDGEATGAYLRDLYHFDITDRLPDIKAPSLLVYGRHDPYVPVSSSSVILEHLGAKDKHLHIIEDAAHMYFFEAWDEFSRVLENWLSEQSQFR